MTAAVDPKPMSRTSAILYAIALPLGLMALVFVPAGRVDWAPGLVFTGPTAGVSLIGVAPSPAPNPKPGPAPAFVFLSLPSARRRSGRNFARSRSRRRSAVCAWRWTVA